MVASQFGVVHQSRTDGRTEQLSDNLGRMTKLLGPDRERKKKKEKSGGSNGKDETCERAWTKGKNERKKRAIKPIFVSS